MNAELISGIEKIRSIVSEARGIEIWPYSNDELVQLTYDIQKALEIGRASCRERVYLCV